MKPCCVRIELTTLTFEWDYSGMMQMKWVHIKCTSCRNWVCVLLCLRFDWVFSTQLVFFCLCTRISGWFGINYRIWRKTTEKEEENYFRFGKSILIFRNKQQQKKSCNSSIVLDYRFDISISPGKCYRWQSEITHYFINNRETMI